MNFVYMMWMLFSYYNVTAMKSWNKVIQLHSVITTEVFCCYLKGSQAVKSDNM